MPIHKSLWATQITDTSTTAKEELGVLRVEVNTDAAGGEKIYRYVLYNNGTANITLTNGAVCYFMNAGTDAYTVTPDISDSDANDGNHQAGVAIGAIADGSYGWIQTVGRHTAVATNGDDDISAGDLIWGVGDGTVDSTTAGTASVRIPLGIALADDVNAADTVEAMLCLPY